MQLSLKEGKNEQKKKQKRKIKETNKQQQNKQSAVTYNNPCIHHR